MPFSAPSSRTLLILLGAVAPALLSLAPGEAFGQGCTGYVLYQETFGSGANAPDVGNPLPAEVTSYHFTSQVVEDGYYSIRREVPHTYQSWLQGTDHTGDGYMMVVNASYDPGLFYQKRIDNLCQGSSFYFSAWVANLMIAGSSGPLDPNIRFEIRRASDGGLIGEYETGTLPRYSTLTWKEYGIHFDLPAGESSVILQMFNNQGGGNGNDLVLDDIRFSLCGPPLRASVEGTYLGSSDICTGAEIKFEATTTAGYYAHPAFQWQFTSDTALRWEDIRGADGLGYTIASTTRADSGWYRIVGGERENLQLEHCRISSDPIPLHVFRPQPIKILANSPVCEGSPLNVALSGGVLSARWTGPGGYSSESQALSWPEATPALDGEYGVHVVTDGGCTAEDRRTLSVQPNDLRLPGWEDTVLCQGQVLVLDASNAGASYAWNTGEEGPTIQVRDPGMYRVRVEKGVCAVADSLQVGVLALPTVSLGRDTTVCSSFPLDLQVYDSVISVYRWQDGSSDSRYTVRSSGRYAVTVSNRCGIASDDIQVVVEECADHLLFPNAFTPNGDGQNDIFRPRVTIPVSGYVLRIYDRYGREVFRSADPAQGWGGRGQAGPAAQGGYVWSAEYHNELTGRQVVEKGALLLLR